MKFPLLRIELRKNRLSAASVALAFFLTLPVSRLVAAATGMEPGRALEAILMGWLILGSPFAAALIASSAGAETASEKARDAEALLPASPLRRAAASLGSAALLLAAVSALLISAAWAWGALGPYMVDKPEMFDWGRPFWMEPGLTVPMFFFCLADVLLVCWILSYLIGHGVAGGLVGLLLTAGALFCAALAGGLEMERHWWGVRVVSDLPWIATASVAAHAGAAVLVARWRERLPRPAGRRAILLGAALLFAPAAFYAEARSAYADLGERLRFGEPPVNFDYQSFQERGPASPAALRADGRETPAYGANGGVYLAGGGGIRAVIPEEHPGLLGLLGNPYGVADIQFAERDEKGALWVVRRVAPNAEYWRQDGEAMKLMGRDDIDWPSVTRDGRRLVVTRWSDKDGYYYGIDDYAKHGQKASPERGTRAKMARAELEAGVARVGCAPAYDCLKRGATTWRLPGRALYSNAAYPHWVAGKPAFLIPVAAKKGVYAALCREGGKVDLAWRLPNKYARFYGLPDGTLYAFAGGDAMGVIGADGAISTLRFGRLRPADAEVWDRPALVRREGGRTWLVWSGRLMELDESGRKVSEAPLAGVEDFRVADGGLLLLDGRGRLSFRGWDGTLKLLRKPSS